MVLTKSELIGSLKNEVRILLHLASKLDRSMLDYRPTPKQRTPMELLRYLSLMGPMLVRFAKAGAFDPVVWTAEDKVAAARDFDQTLAAIAAHSDLYASLIGDMPKCYLIGYRLQQRVADRACGCRRDPQAPSVLVLHRFRLARSPLWADQPCSTWTLEASDRGRQDLLGKPEHDLGKIDAERDRREEDNIDRQRRA